MQHRLIVFDLLFPSAQEPAKTIHPAMSPLYDPTMGFEIRDFTGFRFLFTGLDMSDPDPKSCSVQKQNSGMINSPLSGGGADEKVTIYRRADCLCPEAGRAGDVRT